MTTTFWLEKSQENLGDYAADILIPAEEAERLIGWANEFIEAIRGYLRR